MEVECPALPERQPDLHYRVSGGDATALDSLAHAGPVVRAEERGSHVGILGVEDGT